MDHQAGMSARSARGQPDDTTETAGKYMTFKLGDEEYGIEILNVREIIGLMEITRVPRAAPFVRGVINLRGRVIPVVDLRTKFGMTPTQPTEQTVIIVVQYSVEALERTFGILVDEVLEVLRIDSKDIDAAPDVGEGGMDEGFLSGVGRVDERVIFLLDIGLALSAQRKLSGPRAPSSGARAE